MRAFSLTWKKGIARRAWEKRRNKPNSCSDVSPEKRLAVSPLLSRYNFTARTHIKCKVYQIDVTRPPSIARSLPLSILEIFAAEIPPEE